MFNQRASNLRNRLEKDRFLPCVAIHVRRAIVPPICLVSLEIRQKKDCRMEVRVYRISPYAYGRWYSWLTVQRDPRPLNCDARIKLTCGSPISSVVLYRPCFDTERRVHGSVAMLNAEAAEL